MARVSGRGGEALFVVIRERADAFCPANTACLPLGWAPILDSKTVLIGEKVGISKRIEPDGFFTRPIISRDLNLSIDGGPLCGSPS
jgi:hypothetical protein